MCSIFFAYFWKKWLKNYWHFVTGDKDNYCFIYKDKVYKLKREAVSGIGESVLVKEKIDSRFWIDNIFCVEELAQQCAEYVMPGDYVIAYGRTTCKRDGSGVCLEAVSVLDGGPEVDIEQATDDELTGPLHITLRGSGFHNMKE